MDRTTRAFTTRKDDPVDIVSDKADGALTRRLCAAAAKDRAAAWVVSVTDVDGLAHEVPVDDMSGYESGCVAVCGAVVFPAALVTLPGRRCAPCAVGPIVDPVPERSRGRGFTRAMRRRAAAWLRLTCGAGAYGPCAPVGAR
jgi:hypothetical protein